jgi:hypothetical protein
LNQNLAVRELNRLVCGDQHWAFVMPSSQIAVDFVERFARIIQLPNEDVYALAFENSAGEKLLVMTVPKRHVTARGLQELFGDKAPSGDCSPLMFIAGDEEEATHLGMALITLGVLQWKAGPSPENN